MDTFHQCKFFYAKEIFFGVKGELPKYVCEKGHHLSIECNKSCPDFQPKAQTWAA